MKSINTRLVLYFSVIILLASAVLGYIAIDMADKSLTQEAEKALDSMVAETARVTVDRIEIQKKSLEMLALNPEIQSMDWAVQQSMLQSIVEKTTFLALAVIQPDGTALYSDGTTSQLGDREYVKKALQGEANVSDLIISKVTNGLVLMYAAPIKRDGKIVGALIGRRDGNALSEIIDDTGYGSSGYAYMINDKGTVVAHPDRDKVMNSFNPIELAKKDDSLSSPAKLFEKILSEKRGVNQYFYNGKNLYAAYAPVQGSNWIIVVTADSQEVLAAVPKLQKDILIAAVIILLVAIISVYGIGVSITRPIKAVVKAANHVASLDITHEISPKHLKRKDEIGMLSQALQSIISSLKEIIADINESAEQVAASSEELTATTQQSTVSSEEVSRTIGEISKSAYDQAKTTEEGSKNVEILGQTIEADLHYLKELNNASQKVTEVVQEGLHDMDLLSNITKESNAASKEIYDVIIKTNDSTKKIGQASNVIGSIAGQTNLLALNAAIEAARAGEAGKGFAVVAEEIRKLAEQSSASTKSIDSIISELQGNAEAAVATMGKVTAISEEQTRSVVNSKEKFMDITRAMQEATAAVENLNVSGREMEKIKNVVMDVLQSLSAVAQQNSASTQTVTASIEEQTAAMEEIANASEGLSGLAQHLQTLIKKFTI